MSKEVSDMLNSVILMGRLTADPDYRTAQSGTSVAKFALAVERDYTQNGERQTDFLDIIAWRNTADFVGRYFHKGQLVAVRGSIQVSSYTDRDGNKRRSWNVSADQVWFAESKREGGTPGDYEAEAALPQPPDKKAVADDDLPF